MSPLRRMAVLILATLGWPLGWPLGSAGLASAAAGRVTFPLTAGVASAGATAAVALPDGGAVLVDGADSSDRSGFYAAQLRPDGSLDPSFGSGGITHVVVDPYPFIGEQIVRQPDGKLVMLGFGAGAGGGLPHQVLVRLNPDGSLDRSFGNGGVDVLASETLCIVGCTTQLGVAPDGGLIVTGEIGQALSAANPAPSQWIVLRLTPSGAPDPGFGQAGVVTLPAIGAQGYDVVVLANGDIVTLGVAGFAGGGEYLARLRPSGALDPTFGGGGLVKLPPGAGSSILADADGTIVVAFNGALLRYTAAGAPDASFATGGVAVLPTARMSSQLLPAPDGGVVVVSRRPGVALDEAGLQVDRIAANGSSVGHLEVPLSFGGGRPSPTAPVPLATALSLPPLAQNTFANDYVIQRSDGSYLVVGGVGVLPPNQTTPGRSMFEFAAAALTPTFAPDPRFGEPGAGLQVRLGLATQRAATVRRRGLIAVRLSVSGPGLCLVVIRAHGRVVAQSLLAVFAAGQSRFPVALTSYGASWLRRHHRVTLIATAQARDLLAVTAAAATAGALR